MIAPEKPQREDMKVYDVWKAIQILAQTDIKPARLQSLMQDFQWYHIDEDLEQALRFLTALKAHWRKYETATGDRRVLRAGGDERRGIDADDVLECLYANYPQEIRSTRPTSRARLEGNKVS